MTNSSGGGASGKESSVRTIIIGVVVLVLGGLILGWIQHWGSPSNPAIPQSSPVNSAADQPAASAPATPAAAPAAETPAASRVLTPRVVSTSDAVDDSRCAIPGWTGYPWEDGSPAIGGTPHVGGFTCDVAYTSTKGSLDFLVPAGASRFTAVAGQADDALNTTLTMRFEVINTLTGATLASGDLGYGRSMPVSVSVVGMSRLTLRVSMLSAGTPPREKLGTAAWADPTFK
jgi:hypothetical protein